MIRQPAYRQPGAVGEGLRREVATAYAARYPGPGPHEMAAQQGEAMVHVRAHQRRGEDGRPHGVRAYDRSAPSAGSGRPAGAGQAAPRATPARRTRSAGPAPCRRAGRDAAASLGGAAEPGMAGEDRGGGVAGGRCARPWLWCAECERGAGAGYQMTPIALREAGWQDGPGAWHPPANFPNVRSDAAFLANPAAQEAALTDYLRGIEQRMVNNGVMARLGQQVRAFDGTPITLREANLAAAGHRYGVGGVKAYLEHRDRGASLSAARNDSQRYMFRVIEGRLHRFEDMTSYQRLRP